MILSSLILAATTDPTSIENILLSLGFPGVVIVGLIWFTRYQLKRMEDINKEQADQARRFEDDNRRLYAIMTDQMIPALTRASIAVTDATALLSTIQRERERDELRRQVQDEERRNQ